MRGFLSDRQALRASAAASAPNPDARALETLFSKALSLSDELVADPLKFRTIVHRVDLKDDRVDIAISVRSLLAPAGEPSNEVVSTNPAERQFQLLSVPIVKLRRGPEVRLVIAESHGGDHKLADPALLRLLATARAANAALHVAKDQGVAEVAKAHGYTNNYFTLLLRLATLAPSIVQAIIEGRQPVSLTRQRLEKVTNLPLVLNEQRRVLGFIEKYGCAGSRRTTFQRHPFTIASDDC